jgi:branched-chain amino acid transport system ATP-binding protein
MPTWGKRAEMAFLELRGISARYGAVQALRNVSLSVEKGEIATLIGANGSGKSTTLRVISGLMKPVAGDVLFEGESIVHKSSVEIVEGGIVQCPEGRQVFAQMTVEENLKLGAFAHRRQPDWLAPQERVFELFPVLAERRRQPAGTLSGGEQQMLALGRALMARPRCLLLDEPSLGLAPVVVERIFEVIQEIVASGVTVLLVEQNANLALSVSARAYVLEVGEVTLSGAGHELLADDRVRAAYLGA